MNMKYLTQSDTLRYSNLLDDIRCQNQQDMIVGGSIVKDKGSFQHRISYQGHRLTKTISELQISSKQTIQERMMAISILTMSGMNVSDQLSMKTIELLDFIGVFRHGSVLVGSHAFAAIGNNLGVSWHDGVATQDVDIARHIKLSKASAQHSSMPSIDVSKAMDQAGFAAIPSLNHGQPATNFRHENQMKIDILTPMLGKPDSTPCMLADMRVHAEPLRFMDYLIESPQDAIILTKHGTLALIPQAARYAFHKCIIAQYRDNDSKRHKDIMQAEMILTVLEDRFSFLIKDAWDNLPWQQKAQDGMANFQDSDLVQRIMDICCTTTQ